MPTNERDPTSNAKSHKVSLRSSRNRLLACQRPRAAEAMRAWLICTQRCTRGKQTAHLSFSHVFISRPLWGCSYHFHTDTIKQNSVGGVSVILAVHYWVLLHKIRRADAAYKTHTTDLTMLWQLTWVPCAIPQVQILRGTFTFTFHVATS